MKKLFLIIVAAITGFTASAQQIQDLAVIPIGVTLNSIMRLTVNSGGNIEFVVNTMSQYQKGIANSDPYTTSFSVSSSAKFAVTLQADANALYGTIDATHIMDLDAINYETVANTTGTSVTLGASSTGTLSETAQYLIGAETTGHDSGQFNDIKIKWSLAQGKTDYYLSQFASDRYVVNAYLQLHNIGQ